MFRSLDRDRLLAALADLVDDRAAVFAKLPQVLAQQGEGHVTVSIADPDGTLRLASSNNAALAPGSLLPQDGVVSATFREGRSTYIPCTLEHPAYRTMAAPSYPVEFALPIFERDQVVAILNLERERTFLPGERHSLEIFVNGLSRHLTQVSRSREATVVAELSARLASCSTIVDAANAALEVIAPAVGSPAAAILSDRGGHMRSLGVIGRESARPALEKGTPYPLGLAWEAALTGEPRLSRDYHRDPRGLESLHELVQPVVLAVPIDQHAPGRYVLCLEHPKDAHVSQADIDLLSSVCRQLSLILTGIEGNALQDHLLELHISAFERASADIHQRVLDAAIAHVPGAEAGSLLLRGDGAGDFTYQAVSGFDFEILRDTVLPERNMRDWYAGEAAAWDAGLARILTSEELDLASFSRDAGDTEEPVRAGNLERLKSTVCLPVVYRGVVLAVVNLDNFTRSNAFGADSLHTLRQFASPFAALLAAAQHREEILKASRTDPLTGLVNRTGLTPKLEEQHSAGVLSGRPYSVLVMDLTGFKRVNDSLGHLEGDKALMRVAAALNGVARSEDVIARWGGDEFVALLGGADVAVAAQVGERFKRVVDSIDFRGYELGLDLGSATFPDDGADPSELLLVADSRMYSKKHLKRRNAATLEPLRGDPDDTMPAFETKAEASRGIVS